MAKVRVDSERCKGCLLCISVCPAGLLKQGKAMNSRGAVPVKADGAGACRGCGLCYQVCPDCCIEVLADKE